MKRRPVIGPSLPPSAAAEPPSAVVPQPVSTRPAAAAPRVSFLREEVRILSSGVSGGFPPFDSKVASGVARVTLACALSMVVPVSARSHANPPGVHWPCPTHSGRGEAMSRRLSLAGQLLALQVVIVCVVL